MKVIVSIQSQDPNKTYSIQIEEVMDEKNPQKIKHMKETLGEFIPMGQTPVHVQCLPAPSEKELVLPSGKQKTISGSQLKYLRDLLRKNNISESQCCSENNVGSLEQLTNDATRALINELK